MTKDRLDPPRQPWETAEYEDDPFGLEDIDEAALQVVAKDFLPRPEELVFKKPTRKVTIALDQESIDFFKAEAKRLNLPYQRMIRVLLQEYIARAKQQQSNNPS
jgi:predicted DNA binding CopG/RHH family protein